MKVDKDLINCELKKIMGPLRVLNFLLSRKWCIRILLFTGRLSHGKKIKGLQNEERYIKSNNGGSDIRIRIYKPRNCTTKLPAMLYCHGGGYVIGSPEEYNSVIEKFVKKRPCIVVAPDYRKSATEPYPAAFYDCYDTLLWMKENADSINAKNDNFIIAGHSAGGGLTAAVTLKARDTGDVKIAFQMPIYPMIDDRQMTESSQYTGIPIWDAKTNKLGWRWYHKNLKSQRAEIPAYAAPARNENYSDFPPTITFVGSVEPFRDETLQYVDALKKANIPVEFRLFDGCFHAFDFVAANTEIGKDALSFTFEAYAKFYDKYCID